MTGEARLDDSKLGHIRTSMSARAATIYSEGSTNLLRPAGVVKSAKQAQIPGQTVTYPANAGQMQDCPVPLPAVEVRRRGSMSFRS
jgi:hypothetical protein